MEEGKTLNSHKLSKSLVEKRRRARINRHLDELKELIIEPNSNDGTNYSKMEKANILRMTVQYFRDLRHRKQVLQNTESEKATGSQFVAGFSKCAFEINRYLMSSQDVDVNIKTKLLDHLASCLTSNKPVSSLVSILPKTGQAEEKQVEESIYTPLQILGYKPTFKGAYSSYGPYFPSHVNASPYHLYQLDPNLLQASKNAHAAFNPPMMIDGMTGAVFVPVLGKNVAPGSYGGYFT